MERTDEDVVGLAQYFQFFGGDFAGDSNGETGARKRMPFKEGFGQSEFGAEAADFVLEEGAQRLNEFEVHALGQASDVVVAFDFDARASVRRDAFDDVGIEGSLR